MPREGTKRPVLEPYEVSVLVGDWDGWATVKCVRKKGCKAAHIIHLQTWVEMKSELGRSCPYCYLTSRIPPDILARFNRNERNQPA